MLAACVVKVKAYAAQTLYGSVHIEGGSVRRTARKNSAQRTKRRRRPELNDQIPRARLDNIRKHALLNQDGRG